ncbi:hypothetical protein C8R45DRAFT_1093692 [Mycena sanguinolenta]|nr:hypothetical protein C8R45DRAFT_1093692 [Mycena sanguinolenta]
MFSKILAFGLGALAIVRAAPASSIQMPVLSCSINLDTSASAKSFDPILPGKYLIYNEAHEGEFQLNTYTPVEPIFVMRTREFPGPYGIWEVAPSGKWGSNEYTITNTGINALQFVDLKGQVATSLKFSEGDSFSIEPAGGDTFTIKVPNEDKVWAVNPMASFTSPESFIDSSVGSLS